MNKVRYLEDSLCFIFDKTFRETFIINLVYNLVTREAFILFNIRLIIFYCKKSS